MRRPDPILSKKECYRLWQAGAFGNKLRAWSVDEWLASDFGGPVMLRTTLGGGGPCSGILVPFRACIVLDSWVRDLGVLPADVVVCEAADPSVTTLQGEYWNGVLTDGSWGHFLYSRERQPMRQALATGSQRTTGLASSLLLRGAMTVASWEDWQELLERYPDHVLEVSVYDGCVGDVPGRNALVWEVRKY